jgi:predicted ester cyclase
LSITRCPRGARITGHFTGIFRGVTGKGQPIDFIATDILKVRDGKITDNWHLEDNLTFLKQIGLLPQGPR